MGGVAGSLLLGAVAASAPSKPPQSGIYCLDVPSGKPADVRRVVDAAAKRLRFKVTEATFPFEPAEWFAGGVHHALQAYGDGVSLLVLTATASSEPLDKFENTITRFNPKRYSLQVVKTGWWQRISFAEVLGVFAAEARSAGMAWSKAPEDQSCST